MADPQPDLDDFFAKKDRKKSKNKFPSQLATTTPSKPKKVEQPTSTTTTTVSSTTQEVKEDEGNEWLDYKEEQEKDYSGLKLRQLAEPEPEPEEEPEDNQQEDANPVEPAWKPVAPTAEAAPVAAAVTNLKDEPNKSVYISPALRNAALLGPMKMKSKAAPDLGSDAFFPALGTEPPKPVVLGKLTPSSHSARPTPRAWGPPAGQPSTVSLGNRYNTLDTEDS